MKVSLLVVVVLALILPSHSVAIVIRHDRDDVRYVELGQQLAGICHMNLQEKDAPPDGEAVLIDPSWILTAAHVAVGVERGHVLTVVGHDATLDVEAERVILHPEWSEGPHDIALIRLKRPVEHIDPVPLYRGRDETGQIITVGGLGDFGTGTTGPTTNDGKLRAATNRIDEVSENWLKFRFDEPGRATDLEGISGPGDSGGPAFMMEGDTRFVVGISSGQSTRETGGREGFYGVHEYYTRVSSYIDWIDNVIRGEHPPEE